jgi:cytochrome c-type biogenesis protein
VNLLLGTTLFASFLGGVVALLAPCCVSVMLPAYFASMFHRRTQIVGMTLIFAAGVATLILPIALGASALSGLVSGHHTLVFSIGGLAMMAMGIAMLFGVKFMLPMPSLRGGTGRGLGSVYGLGVFSGAASSCCAPVLAGVATISGAAASFPAALAIGIAYVFGMVAPMSILAVVWDRRDWGQTRLLAGRAVTWRLGGRARSVPLSAVISGGLLLVMGVLTVIIAFRRQSMATDGWQVQVSAALTHAASVVRDNLAWVPGWVLSVLLIGALTSLVIRAIRGRRSSARTSQWPVAEDHSDGDAASEATSSGCADPFPPVPPATSSAATRPDAQGAPTSEDPHAPATTTKESHR